MDLARRDVVSVPVALNYDRVLEDRVLISAAHKSERRFDAGIGHVARAVTRQLWLRVTGRFHRFGYAAVSFGRPVSLRAEPALVAAPEALAQTLMDRIAAVIPVLPVPLAAHLLQQGPKTRAELELAFSAALDGLTTAHVHLPRNNRDYAVEVGLRALTERGIVTEKGGLFEVAEPETVAFYARSIAHLM
jgi:glycerol-3-phosphate O-acyltransferase